MKGMNMMRSMTDFIDTVSNTEHLAVYNEDYSWAEEYADYFNEESVNYVQPILESSEYQFFGETCFIQEASKVSNGLLAGGILALLSGAFFMIMKLLNGGGGGGGSSSGSTSSSSSSNKTNNRFNNNNNRPPSGGGGNSNNKPPTNPPSGGSAGQPQVQALQTEKLKAAEAELQRVIEEKHKAEEETRRTLQRMDQMQKENDAKLKAQNDAFNAKIKADQEAKAKAAKEKADAKAAEDEKQRKALLEESKRKAEESKRKAEESKRKAEESKKAEEVAYVKPAELEAEEDLVFNSKIIIDELNKLKKQGYDETDVRNGHELQNILQGLEKIDEITDFLVKLVRDEHWDIFGSSVTEKGYAETFHKKCTELHEIVKTIQLESSKINDENGSSYDISIDSVISDIKNIDKVTKAIESKCKEGMKLCKAERTKLINAKKDVSNVDKAYKILNGIIRDVNVVCKNIQTAFRTVHKSIYGKRYPFPMKVTYYNILAIGASPDPFYKETERSVLDRIRKNNPRHIPYSEMYDHFTHGIEEAMNNIFYATDGTKITEWDINNAETRNKEFYETSHKTLASSRNNAGKVFGILKKNDKNHEEIYNIIENVIMNAYDAIDELLNIPIRKFAGSTIRNCEVPQFKKCHDMYLDYFVKSGEKRKELKAKIKQIAESKEVKMDSISSDTPNTPVGNFYADIGKNMNKLEGVIRDSYLSGLKKAYEKGLKVLNDPDDDDEDAFSEIYTPLINVWKSQNELSKDDLKHLISFMNSIGFKEVNISKGQKLKQKDGRYFKDIYIQPTDDPSLDYVIKGIFEYPMEMHITLDDDDFHAILPGNASMYRVKG
jgi:chemotaxis protein histidine kinase CheA